MPRHARAQCESSIYHVTARGVGQQIIFEDNADRKRFGTLMRTHSAEYEVEFYAWCLMQNHVHLLLHSPMTALSSFMKQLLADYARYFNVRHNRTGHLFQGRFNSKPVEDERQFLATIRYIHQNPIDIGVSDFASYPWSSYREYVTNPFITDTEPALKGFGGLDSLVHAHLVIEEDTSLEPDNRKYKNFSTDDAAIIRAKQVTGCAELSAIASAERQSRNAKIALLRADGFTIAQIARITGISRSVIQRVT